MVINYLQLDDKHPLSIIGICVAIVLLLFSYYQF